MICYQCRGTGTYVREGRMILCPCRPGPGLRAQAPATKPPPAQARPDRQRRPRNRRGNGY